MSTDSTPAQPVTPELVAHAGPLTFNNARDTEDFGAGDQPRAQPVTPGTKIWFCKIGEASPDFFPRNADGPMRDAVYAAYRKVTGVEADFVFSGWGAELTESERAVVEDRLPHDSAEPVTELEDARALAHQLTVLVEQADEGLSVDESGARSLRLAAEALTAFAAVSAREPGAEEKRLRAIIERDRARGHVWIERLRAVLARYAWLKDSRGSYEWDDKRYKTEFARAHADLDRALTKAESELRVRDLTDCPETQAEADAALAAAPQAETRSAEPRKCGHSAYDQRCGQCMWAAGVDQGRKDAALAAAPVAGAGRDNSDTVTCESCGHVQTDGLRACYRVRLAQAEAATAPAPTSVVLDVRYKCGYAKSDGPADEGGLFCRCGHAYAIHEPGAAVLAPYVRGLLEHERERCMSEADANSRVAPELEGQWRDRVHQLDAALGDPPRFGAALASRVEPPAVRRVIDCPECYARHIDEGEWATRPHRTHLCANCGNEWRPFDFFTIGIAAPEAAEGKPHG